METTKIQRSLELKFKGKRPVGRPTTRLFIQVPEYMKTRGKTKQEIKKEKTVGRKKR
jgi:hypothetical protein